MSSVVARPGSCSASWSSPVGLRLLQAPDQEVHGDGLLVFSNNQVAQQVAGLQAVASSNNPLALQNTNLKLVQLGDMAAKTAGTRPRVDKETVTADLSVTAQGESNIVNVAATATSPALAADIANTYTGVFVTEQQNATMPTTPRR